MRSVWHAAQISIKHMVSAAASAYHHVIACDAAAWMRMSHVQCSQRPCRTCSGAAQSTNHTGLVDRACIAGSGKLTAENAEEAAVQEHSVELGFAPDEWREAENNEAAGSTEQLSWKERQLEQSRRCTVSSTLATLMEDCLRRLHHCTVSAPGEQRPEHRFGDPVIFLTQLLTTQISTSETKEHTMLNMCQ